MYSIKRHRYLEIHRNNLRWLKGCLIPSVEPYLPSGGCAGHSTGRGALTDGSLALDRTWPALADGSSMVTGAWLVLTSRWLALTRLWLVLTNRWLALTRL